MTRLFSELYLDEDVSVLVADLLRARGFAAVTTRETGRLGQGDAEQLAYAIDQRKVLLTHNRADFEMLAREYFSTHRSHYGIIIAVRRPREEGKRVKVKKGRGEYPFPFFIFIDSVKQARAERFRDG